MAKKPTAPATPVRLDAVAKLINEAGQAASTLLSKAKEAAQGAAAQLDPAKPVKARIDAVVSLYAVDFAAAGANVKALFVDALTLHAAAQTPVAVRAMGKDGKMEDQHVTAGDAVNMAKHAMRDAAKQVREALGIGRKAGGGRKAATPKAASTAPTATAVDAFSEWLDHLPEYLEDQVFHAKIQACLITSGWTIAKAAKGKIIKGAASA